MEAPGVNIFNYIRVIIWALNLMQFSKNECS